MADNLKMRRGLNGMPPPNRRRSPGVFELLIAVLEFDYDC